jgi:hypothetical protein
MMMGSGSSGISVGERLLVLPLLLLVLLLVGDTVFR